MMQKQTMDQAMLQPAALHPNSNKSLISSFVHYRGVSSPIEVFPFKRTLWPKKLDNWYMIVAIHMHPLDGSKIS